MPNELELLKKEVGELRLLVDSMQNFNTITPAFSKVLTRAIVTDDSKTAASETQAVVEGGSSNYDVAKPMDGFKDIGGFLFPFYNP